jgi:hypothetical protein
MKNTRSRLMSWAISLSMIGLMTQAAVAASPHFIGTPTCVKSAATGLTCSGKAAGLGDGPTVAFLTADSVSATYECVNHGGNVAPGQPIVTQSVSGPQQPITAHNGQISFSPTLSPPAKPDAATECPSGKWTVRTTSLTFTNVVLHIQQPSGTDVLTFNFGNL